MMRQLRRGQTTAEFAIVFAVFALLVFGVIEVGRAIYEKQALVRAAETLVQSLAQADPPTKASTNSPTFWTTFVPSLVKQANQNAALGLSTAWPSTVTVTQGYYNAGSGTCVTSGGDPNQPCEFAANIDGHVVVIGLPSLNAPMEFVVTITVPYQSYIGYPLQLLGGQATETVAATTRCGQFQQGQLPNGLQCN